MGKPMICTRTTEATATIAVKRSVNTPRSNGMEEITEGELFGAVVNAMRQSVATMTVSHLVMLAIPTLDTGGNVRIKHLTRFGFGKQRLRAGTVEKHGRRLTPGSAMNYRPTRTKHTLQCLMSNNAKN